MFEIFNLPVFCKYENLGELLSQFVQITLFIGNSPHKCMYHFVNVFDILTESQTEYRHEIWPKSSL